MRGSKRTWIMVSASVLLLAGCVVSGMPYAGRHLSPQECHDLTALKTNPHPTLAEHQTEAIALRKAGYDPSPWDDDPFYPDDLQAAQRVVDYWYRAECQQPGSVE